MDTNAKGQDLIATGQTVQKCFTQDEVNHLISMRVKRERVKLTKEFEDRFQSRFSNIGQTKQGQLVLIKPEVHTVTKDTLVSGESPKQLVDIPVCAKVEKPHVSRNNSVSIVDLSANDGHVLHITFASQRCSCRRNLCAGRHRRRSAAKGG